MPLMPSIPTMPHRRHEELPQRDHSAVLPPKPVSIIKRSGSESSATILMDHPINQARRRVRLWIGLGVGGVMLLIVIVLSASLGTKKSSSSSSSLVTEDGGIAQPTSGERPPVTNVFTTGGGSNGGTGSAEGFNRNFGTSPWMNYPPTASPTTAAPTASAAPTELVDEDTMGLCECETCTHEIWHQMSGEPERTCGQRINWLLKNFPNKYLKQSDACRQVAFEFPCECGQCDPSRCGLPIEDFKAPDSWIPRFQPVAPAKQKLQNGLYCYPYERTTFYMWNGMTVEAKQSEELCGPGFNKFSNETMYEKDGELYLTYANQQASEVRVTLPNDQLYGYGKYTFGVKSIQVLDAAGNVKDDKLPNDLVLGLFTWDDTDDYAIHENWNHEVDIEISRWGCEDNSDVQFLTQPPGFPQMYRFFSGEDATYDQAGHVYSFNWLPNRIDWETDASGGQTFSLTTEHALYKNIPDYVQCMPSGYTEVRMNLWNMNGAEVPTGLAPDDKVVVVIDDFSYERASVYYAEDGDFCSKSCQCGPASECLNSRCTNIFTIKN